MKLVSRIRVITHPRARLGALGRPMPLPTPAIPATISARHAPTVVAIGASTGGPGAIVEILRALPAEFRLPILLVLHINEPFGAAFADWLDGQTTRRVAYAQDGEPWQPPPVASSWRRQTGISSCADGRLRLTRRAGAALLPASVDVLFESVAQEYGAAVAACLLTGMGRDGASGLLDIRKRGRPDHRAGRSDIASSYGMPREADRLGAAARVLPLPRDRSRRSQRSRPAQAW